MIDFMFFVKTVLLTVALVLLMQIEVGEKSVEVHAHNFITSSIVVSPLNKVAQGGAKVIRDLSGWVSRHVNSGGQDKKKKEERSHSSFRWSHEFNQEQKSN